MYGCGREGEISQQEIETARQDRQALNERFLTAASAIDGDYNAGVEAAAKLTDGEGQPMLAAEIRKLKR